MDDKYVICSEELTHHGIKGQRWGIRRFQNRDGTLTAYGKKRYNKELEKAKAEQRIIKNKEQTKAKLDKLEALKADNAARKKALEPEKKEDPAKKSDGKKVIRSVKDLSDDELAAIVRRARLEQDYNNLNPKKVSLGKKILNDVLAPSLMSSAKNVMNDFATKKGKELLGLNDTKEDPLKKLRDDVNRMDLEKRYKDLTADDPLKNLRDDVNRMQLEKQFKELSSFNLDDKKLANDVTRMTLEKRYEELLKERKKKN